MAYDRLEPFGELRADYRNGLLIATVLGIMGEEADPRQFMLLPPRTATVDRTGISRGAI